MVCCYMALSLHQPELANFFLDALAQRDKPSRLTQEAVEQAITNSDPPGRDLADSFSDFKIKFSNLCRAFWYLFGACVG
jgi:hypothetical protein